MATVLQCAAGHKHTEGKKKPGDICAREEVALQCDKNPTHVYLKRRGHRKGQKCPMKAAGGAMACKGRLKKQVTTNCESVLYYDKE